MTRLPIAAPAPTVLGLDAGHAAVAGAEAWLLDLVAALGRDAVTLACTHMVPGEHPHVAASLWLAGPAVPALPESAAPAAVVALRQAPARVPTPWRPAGGLAEGAAHAARCAAARSDGRAVLFPGGEGLTGTVLVADLLAGSAIDAVHVLGGAPAEDDQELVTRDFVRPVWRDGALVLVAQPAAGGRLVPFEHPAPTPCCADHC